MEVRPVTLEGQHVRLDPMESGHVDPLFEAGNHPEIWTYMPMRVNTRADMERLVANALAARDNGTELPFVIVYKASGKVVGSTRFLDILPQHRNLEIGWTWLSPEVWRTPVNTECKYLLLQHCFETLGCMRVQLKADSRNERSIAAMERIGAVREGVLRKHRITYDGHIRHSVYFSILDDEWPAVKETLERKLYRVHDG
jgi:N-acetyltransferase